MLPLQVETVLVLAGVVTGRASKTKGATAEREVVAILNEHGFDVHRQPHSGALSWAKGDVTGWPGFSVEIKRCESLRIPDWCRQAERQCAEGDVPLVIFRRSREPWRVVVPLDAFLRLVER